VGSRAASKRADHRGDACVARNILFLQRHPRPPPTYNNCPVSQRACSDATTDHVSNVSSWLFYAPQRDVANILLICGWSQPVSDGPGDTNLTDSWQFNGSSAAKIFPLCGICSRHNEISPGNAHAPSVLTLTMRPHVAPRPRRRAPANSSAGFARLLTAAPTMTFRRNRMQHAALVRSCNGSFVGVNVSVGAPPTAAFVNQHPDRPKRLFRFGSNNCGTTAGSAGAGHASVCPPCSDLGRTSSPECCCW